VIYKRKGRPVESRRDFLKKVSLGSLGLMGGASLPWFFSCQKKIDATGSRPNIVLIMADDMGYSDIGCYGGEIHTPNLDRLAEGGLRFTHFHNTARCCPTRASLLTGLYPHQAGVGHMMADRGVDGYRGDLNKNCVTIAEVLKLAGYSTYMSGKWHVTRFLENDGPKHNWPLQRGFDRFFGTITGSGSFWEPMTISLGNQHLQTLPEGFYYTDAISDHAVQFIREHHREKPGKPFFLYVPYTAPHWPLHAWERDIAKYTGRYDKGWDELREERYGRMIAMGIIDPAWKLTQRDPRVPPWRETEHKKWQARRMEVYAAQVDCMDQGIGRIIGGLEKRRLLNNTLIFFLSDNGGCAEEITDTWKAWIIGGGEYVGRARTLDGRLIQIGNDPDHMPGPYDTYQSYGIPWANVSNTPFRLYKHWVHEGGVATPLIAHWPDRLKASGEFCHQTGHLIDVMATCIDVTGISYPAEFSGHPITPMEGKSLVSAFENKAIDREAIYFEHEGNRAVLAGMWKLVARGRDGPWELYDIAKDRTETADLAAEFPEKVTEMAKMWQSWAERTGVIPWPT
jgi:arylsulfatase A-like enzyme